MRETVVKHKLSKISKMHYVRLVLRSLLLITALALYIYNKVEKTEYTFGRIAEHKATLGIIWLVYFAEMICRFFPAKFESMGCQKQFKCNHVATGETKPNKSPWQGTFLSLAFWVVLNGAFGVLYYTHVFDKGILVLISLAYGVCDMICVLFFCPFQTWFMKNKCCTTCRIYNWDYAMMFTPLVFFPSIFGWSILGVSLLLLAQWELLYRIHPERFAENTNCNLNCAHCTEKLCSHKKQLRSFHRKQKQKEHKE